MSGGRACSCTERKESLAKVGNRAPRLWRVLQRHCNHSAFNGYHETRSDWSSLICLRCGTVWRTKADYVDNLEDATREELEAPGANTTHIGDRDVTGVHAQRMVDLGREPYDERKERFGK